MTWHHVANVCGNLVAIFLLKDASSFLFGSSIVALRKAEKEEEKRAREKIRQRLEEDKVFTLTPAIIFFLQKFVLD